MNYNNHKTIRTTLNYIGHFLILASAVTEELHKPIIRLFEKRKVHSSFIDNI